MMGHFAQVKIRIEKDIVTRIIRTLPGKGILNVSVGQQVAPDEIIGTATLSAGFRSLNLAALLSVPPDQAERFLTRKLKQRIYKGELLAYKKDWLGRKKVVVAPTDGVIDFLNNKTGEMRITFLPQTIKLPAGVFGIVEQVNPEKGLIIIKTLVSRIRGICGSGRMRDGVLHILSKKGDLITKSLIQSRYDGHILVGGSLFFKDAISAAISAGVNGIITGGINAQDYRAIAGGRLVFPKKLDNDIGISVVACEGFGSVSIGNDIFDLLEEYEGKFVLIDGNRATVSLPSFSSTSLIRVKNTKLPEIPTIMDNMDNLKPISELKLGLRVRVVGNSYFGEQGKITALNDSPALLPSGIKAYLATVECATRKVQVPVANLEIIV